MLRTALLSLTLALFLTASGPAALGAGGLRSLEGTELGDLLERFDEAQEQLQTLEAEFRETREDGLFADPVVLAGHLYLEKPERILWAYREPEARYFLLEGRILTAWYPEQGVAERQNVRKHGKRLRRMVGLGETSQDLVRNNEVSLLTRSEVEGARELVLVPRNRRLREHLPEVRLWVDEETALPVQVRYLQSTGDRVTLRILDSRRNEPLPEEAMVLPIPPGTEIREELSSLGPFDSADE
jgi:outer membrane lipoprotein-sorting protein